MGGKSQVALGFLRNSGTEPLEKQLESLGPNETGPIASYRRHCVVVLGQDTFILA